MPDSELVEFSYRGARCSVVIKAWNEELHEIEFTDVIALSFPGGRKLEYVRSYVTLATESFLFAAMHRSFVHPHTGEWPYRAFEFVDDDGGVVLVVVAVGASGFLAASE